jgi:C-terminal processing protease CtpA/Prc
LMISTIALPVNSVLAGGEAEAEEMVRMKEEQQRLVAEAQEVRQQAQKAVEESTMTRAEVQEVRQQAQKAVEDSTLTRAEAQSAEQAEMQRMREKLSRTHRELREISSQVARAHRQLERESHVEKHVRVINVGDRAILGVVLGETNDDGVELVGISPDGPAERAGLQQGDVLVAIAGEELAGHTDGAGRSILFEVMDEVSPGEEILVEVLRNDETWEFTVTPEQREPRSWQSVIRLPGAPHAPGAPNVVIENIVIPEFDEAELAVRIKAVENQAEHFAEMFDGEDGMLGDAGFSYQFDSEAFSDLGQHAMREANVWFGLPQHLGLELTSLKPELGKYFKADRGVLVLEAREDNTYGLEAGDVIQDIADDEVNSPSDLLRALRDAEPGTEIELGIIRHGKAQTLQAEVSENRLSMLQHHGAVHAPEPPVAPAEKR